MQDEVSDVSYSNPTIRVHTSYSSISRSILISRIARTEIKTPDEFSIVQHNTFELTHELTVKNLMNK